MEQDIVNPDGSNPAQTDKPGGSEKETVKPGDAESQTKDYSPSKEKKSREKEALKEYFELCRRYPLHKRRRRGIGKELEKLAEKYPDVSFPGSHKIKLPATEYEAKIKAHAEKLRLVMKEKLNRKCASLLVPVSIIKALYFVNQSEMATGKEIRENTGLSRTSLIRVARILRDLGFIKNHLSGKYHRYEITGEGRKFLD